MAGPSRAARLAVAWSRRARDESRLAEADYMRALRGGDEAEIWAAGVVSDHMWLELVAAREARLSATLVGIEEARSQ